MSGQQYQPEWEYAGTALSWRMWAVGYYQGGDFNRFWRVFAVGPARILFRRLKTTEERAEQVAVPA